jgi:hypothetical protein
MSSLFETLSLTCRRIILEDLQVDMEIGAHAEEHGRAQPVLVTIEVWVPFEYSTATGDNLDEVYSYSVLSQIVTETISEGKKLSVIGCSSASSPTNAFLQRASRQPNCTLAPAPKPWLSKLSATESDPTS